MTKTKCTQIAAALAEHVRVMHEGRRSWNKACGQWLVYGFEAKLGFAGAVALEAAAEIAWRKKQDVEVAIFGALKEIYQEAGKWEVDHVV